MKPENTRVSRREQRTAWRRFRQGRRATHKVETTYGRGQRDRHWHAAWDAARAAFAAKQEEPPQCL